MSYWNGGVIPLSSNGLIGVAVVCVETWGLPNKNGRLAVYVGETRGGYEVAGNPADTLKPEIMLLAEPYGSVSCEQTIFGPLPPWSATAGSSERDVRRVGGILVVVQLPTVGVQLVVDP